MREILGWTLIELAEFAQYRDQYFETDSAFAEFQVQLASSPYTGDVMPGCGGLRKIRWSDPRRGKGKRGGLRVIYLLIPESQILFLFDVYDKDEADDLSPQTKRVLTEIARGLKRWKD